MDTDVDSGAEATPDAVLKKIISVHINNDGPKLAKTVADDVVKSGSEEELATTALDGIGEGGGGHVMLRALRI